MGTGWFSSRWRGDTPLATVFWRDMILVGTVVNAAASLAAIGLLAADAPAVIAFGAFLAPVPWNLFLFFSVWRSAAKAAASVAMAAQMAAVIWLIAATTL